MDNGKNHGGNPHIAGGQVTLYWQGENAPGLRSDLHGWDVDALPLQKAGAGMWSISFALHEDAYLEYAFFDLSTQKRLPEPLNPRRIHNGFDGYNSYFYMPAAAPTPFASLPRGGLRGHLTTHRAPAREVTASRERSVTLYHPPVDEPAPLLVVLDGPDYLRRGRLAVILDNLIAARRIRPLAAAFCANGGPARTVEYGGADPSMSFLVDSVLPLAARELSLLDYEKAPGAHCVLGASMGGSMAVFAALSDPGVFGMSISQAGAFIHWGHTSTVMQMARYYPRADVRLWLDCGRMDGLLQANRDMNDLLVQKGYRVTYRENGGAHNFTTWRDACARAFEEMFA